MKRTLLDIVQTILSSMDSDEVNSISDTVESMQVAEVVRTVWEQLVVETNLPEHFALYALNPSGDNAKPTLMSLPATADNLLWLKYNHGSAGAPEWREVKFKTPEQFVLDMHELEAGSNVISFTLDNVVYYARNDKQPEFYTSINDSTILFDSYDATVDATLQSSKTVAYGERVITFEMEDDYIPVLDSNQFPLLLNEAKALAFAELKQAAHAKAEKKAREGKIRLQRTKQNIPGNTKFYDTLPHYGRK